MRKLKNRFPLLLVLWGVPMGASAAVQKAEKPPEVVTITEMQAGDAACYLFFKDAKNKMRSADGSHHLCQDTFLLNQKATLTYSQAKILAGRCEGNPDCPHTETVLLVDSAELVPPKDLCQKGEVLYQGCGTTKGNVISFCTKEKFKNDRDKTPSYLVLRYGTPKKTAMEVVSKPKAAIESRIARYAGGNTRLMFRWKHEGKDYLFESAYIEIARVHGMSTYQKDKQLNFDACRDHRPEQNKLTEPHQYDGF